MAGDLTRCIAHSLNTRASQPPPLVALPPFPPCLRQRPMSAKDFRAFYSFVFFVARDGGQRCMCESEARVEGWPLLVLLRVRACLSQSWE